MRGSCRKLRVVTTVLSSGSVPLRGNISDSASRLRMRLTWAPAALSRLSWVSGSSESSDTETSRSPASIKRRARASVSATPLDSTRVRMPRDWKARTISGRSSRMAGSPPPRLTCTHPRREATAASWPTSAMVSSLVGRRQMLHDWQRRLQRLVTA